MCDTEGHIEHVSSSVINVLRIDNHLMAQKHVHIEELVPNIFSERENYTSAQGLILRYEYPKREEDIAQNLTESSSVELKCWCYPIVMSVVGTTGYVFKFEKVADSTPRALATPKKPKSALNFNFKFQPASITSQSTNEKSLNTYFGEFTTENHSDMLTVRVEESVMDENMNMSMMTHDRPTDSNIDDRKIGSTQSNEKKDGESDVKDSQPGKLHYAEGIKTMRLFEGHIGEIEEDKSEDEEEEEYMQGYGFNGVKQQGEGKSFWGGIMYFEGQYIFILNIIYKIFFIFLFSHT